MLVSRQGDRDFVKVLDFGLAKVAPETLTLDGKGAEPALTKHGTVFGTPKYMAPEQCVCQPVDARTDLYALGWVLFEMLTGVHPYAAKDVLTIVRHQLSTPTPAMQSVAPAVRIPAALEAVVQRLTDKRPEHRYASATAAHAALAEVLAQEDAAPPSRAAAPAAGPSPQVHTDAAKTVASVELVSAIDIPTPSAAPAGAVVAPAAKSDGTQAAAAPAAAGPGAASQPGGTAAPNSGSAAPASTGAAAAGASASAASTGAAGATPAGATASATPDAAVVVLAAPPGAVARRDAVPAFLARLPPPLQQRPALLLVPVALLGLGLVWLLHTPSTPGPKAASGRATAARSAAQTTPAPKAQLEQAIAAGAPELLNLVKAFPGDARVKRALAHTYMAQHNGMEALRWLAKVTALDASLVQDGEILQAAKLAFNRAEQADDTIAVLETELGERGVDALYLLAVRPGPIRLKLKFNQSLAKPEVRKRASRAALVALELRAAATCEQKRALLPRAKHYGDRRALQLLSWWSQKQNCGPFGLADCAACLRQDGTLQSAIAAIAGRVGTDN